MRPFTTHISKRARGTREDGSALVIALGVMLVLSIAATSVLAFTSANTRSASVSGSRQSATSLAEAGVEYARATLWALPPAQWTSDGTLPTRTVTVEGRTVTYWGTRSGNTWTLTGRTTVPNPSGGTAVTRTAWTQVRVVGATGIDPNDLAVWQSIFQDNPNGCINLKNNNRVYASVYSRGGLCLKNNDTVSGSIVQVEKTLTMGQGTKIGDPSKPVDKVQVKGGCGSNGGQPRNCDSSDGVYATTSDVVPAGYTKPPVDFAYWHANAAPGPLRGCTTGTFLGAFDTDGTLNGSLVSGANLTPAVSYSCVVRDASNAVIGELAWSTSGKTLTVRGTIFFDGPVRIGGGTTVVGAATIYSNGSIAFGNNTTICAVPACDDSWASSPNRLALVVNGDVTFENDPVFQGAIYATGDFVAKNSGHFYGPIVADTIELNNGAVLHDATAFGVLDGMPHRRTSTTSLQNVAGTYGQA